MFVYIQNLKISFCIKKCVIYKLQTKFSMAYPVIGGIDNPLDNPGTMLMCMSFVYITRIQLSSVLKTIVKLGPLY